jgi:hypothetical protein
MALMSAWYFTELATIYPYESANDWNGGVTYGTPYTIACGREGVSRQSRDQEGAEFVTRDVYYTGDNRPKFLDRIAPGDTTAQTWDAVNATEIRKVAYHGMSALGYDPEYDLETM